MGIISQTHSGGGQSSVSCLSRTNVAISLLWSSLASRHLLHSLAGDPAAEDPPAASSRSAMVG